MKTPNPKGFPTSSTLAERRDTIPEKRPDHWSFKRENATKAACAFAGAMARLKEFAALAKGAEGR